MSPAPGVNRQIISGEIFSAIHNYLDDKPCRVFSAPLDVFLPEAGELENETSTIVQPDIVVIGDEANLS